MTEDEHENQIAEFHAKVDELMTREKFLVGQFNSYLDGFRAMVAEYAIALAKEDKAGIALYDLVHEELHKKMSETDKLIQEVRAEYDELERHRPLRPRQTWSQFFGLAAARLVSLKHGRSIGAGPHG
jgi:hypothetical protein